MALKLVRNEDKPWCVELTSLLYFNSDWRIICDIASAVDGENWRHEYIKHGSAIQFIFSSEEIATAFMLTAVCALTE